MKILKWLFLTCSIFIFCQANAQAKLGVTIDSFPTHLVLTDTATYHGYFAIHNFGIDTFNGSFSLNYTVNSILYSSTTDSGIYYPSTALIIPPGDSSTLQQLIINVNSTTGAFTTIGSSAVVIWPISATGATFDSAFVAVEVTFMAGISPTVAQNLHVFINQQQLFINTNAQNLLKRVRIFDVQGQLLVEQPVSLSAVIPMNKYPAAIYFAEVTLSDDSRQVFRIVNIGSR